MHKTLNIQSASIILGMMIVFLACNNSKQPRELFVKDKICDHLWREKYKMVQGSTFSTAQYSDYLTDSVNFRVYVGDHDEYSSFSYECSGDSIVVKKFKHLESQKKELARTSVLSLINLRKRHNFH